MRSRYTKLDSINVLDEGRLICVAITEEDATRIVFALNYLDKVEKEARERAKFYNIIPE